MARQSAVFEVLIASPSDVREERTVLAEVIEDWNSANSGSRGVSLQALRWELDSIPESGHRAQEIINRQLVGRADVLMVVFWARLGTPTADSISGTVEEIGHFRSSGKPVLLYFCESDIPLRHDAEQLRRLKEYQDTVRSHTLYDTFRDAEDLRRRATRHLAKLMNELAPSSVGFKAQLHARKIPAVKLVFDTQDQSVIPGTSIKPVRVFATIENSSTTERIREYSVTLSVPRCCMGFQTPVYPAEMESRDPNYRRLRHTERDWGNRSILPGDRLQVISVDVAVGHLSSEQRESCLKEEFIGQLVADGEAYEARATLAELLAGRI